MEEEMDLKLKNYLITNENFEVPQKISSGIDNTLSGLKQNRGNRLLNKKGLIAAAIVISVLIGVNSLFPALASEIPLVNKILGKNSVFNKANNPSDDGFLNLKEVQNYSIGLDQTITQNSTSVKIKELAYDGAAIYIAYEVSGDINTKINRNNLYDIKSNLEIQGKKIEKGAFIPEKIDTNTVLIKEIYPLSGTYKLPQKFELSYKITSISEQSGNWDFKFNINNINDLAQNVKRKTINKELMLGPDKAKILTLVESPAFETITVQYDNYIPDSYYFAIMDEEGNELQGVDLGGMVKNGKKTEVTYYYKRINYNRASKIILLQPQISYFSSEKIQNRTYIDLNEKMPKNIPIAKDKELEISNIKSTSKNIEVTLEVKDTAMRDYVFHGGINLFNKKLNEKDHNAYSMAFVEALGKNTYKVTINKKEGTANDGNTNIIIGNYDEVLKEVEQINVN